MQTKGYQWLMGHQKSQDILKVKGSYFVLSSTAKIGTDLKSCVKRYIQYKEKLEWEGFDEYKTLKTTVYELIVCVSACVSVVTCYL